MAKKKKNGHIRTLSCRSCNREHKRGTLFRTRFFEILGSAVKDTSAQREKIAEHYGQQCRAAKTRVICETSLEIGFRTR